MTYTIKFVNFTLRALFQKIRPLPALYGSYVYGIFHSRRVLTIAVNLRKSSFDFI